MYKWSHITMVFMLSISIVAPSVISLWNDHYDIEISTDLGEEDTNKESKKELEEKDTFLETFSIPALASVQDVKLFQDSYQLPEGSFTAKIHLPPPKLIS